MARRRGWLSSWRASRAGRAGCGVVAGGGVWCWRTGRWCWARAGRSWWRVWRRSRQANRLGARCVVWRARATVVSCSCSPGRARSGRGWRGAAGRLAGVRGAAGGVGRRWVSSWTGRWKVCAWRGGCAGLGAGGRGAAGAVGGDGVAGGGVAGGGVEPDAVVGHSQGEIAAAWWRGTVAGGRGAGGGGAQPGAGGVGWPGWDGVGGVGRRREVRARLAGLGGACGWRR